MKRLTRSLLKYKFLIPFVVLALIPIVWFLGKGGAIINGVDTNFPLNPLIWFLRRLYVWNSVSNAGADFSASVAGIFFHLVQLVPYLLGFKLQHVEILSLIFWFSLTIFSSLFMANAIFPKRFIPKILFTVFYSLNVYLFNTWENVKVTNISLTAAIPIALGTLILMDRNRISVEKGVLLSVLAGVIVSGTGINPAYFVCFYLIFLLYFLGSFISSGKEKLFRLRNFVLVSATIFLINAFWIAPTANYIFKGIPTGGSLDKIGFTNWVDSLSENTSLFNVIRLQGAWDWYSVDSVTGLPLYIPYALNYFNRFPFIVFSLLIPALAIASLVFRKRNNGGFYISFSFMLLLGIFLGCGTHPPTGTVFKFLLNHVPFFSLFRSPWYIFTPLVTLSYAGLIGLLFDRIYEFIEINKIKIGKVFLSFVGLVLIVGNLLYCYPLVTGKIFRPGRSDGFYINFPEYVFKAGEWLTNSGSKGRVVGYPDDEIENFDWGYRGIESILSLISNKETIFSSLNSPDFPISKLVKDFYVELKVNRLASALSLANKLNIDYLFKKNDQPSLAGDLSNVPLGSPEAVFDKWSFYKLPNASPKKIYASDSTDFLFTDSNFTGLSLISDGDSLDPNDKAVTKIPDIKKLAGNVVLATNSQKENFNKYLQGDIEESNIFTKRDFSFVNYSFSVPEDGDYKIVIDKNGLNDFGINYKNGLSVKLDRGGETLTYLNEDDSFVYFSPIFLNQGDNNLSFKLEDNNLIDSIFSGDFNNKDSKVIYTKDDTLTINNRSDKDASSTIGIENIDLFSSYYAEFSYRQFYGASGKVSAIQFTPSAVININSTDLPNYLDWNKVSFYINPIKVRSKIDLQLSAPASYAPLGTKVGYSDLKIGKVFTNNLYLVEESKDKSLPSTPQISYQEKSPVLYSGEVTNHQGPHFLVFLENYSPDWQITFFDNKGKKIEVNPPHFTMNGYANGWFIENMPESYSFKIYYKPQSFYKLGILISGLVIVLSFVFFIYKKNENK